MNGMWKVESTLKRKKGAPANRASEHLPASFGLHGSRCVTTTLIYPTMKAHPSPIAIDTPGQAVLVPEAPSTALLGVSG